jgi:hypothetical protein
MKKTNAKRTSLPVAMKVAPLVAVLCMATAEVSPAQAVSPAPSTQAARVETTAAVPVPDLEEFKAIAEEGLIYGLRHGRGRAQGG